MCSHHRTCAGKYLFRQQQKGWQVAQPSARTQNGALRKLAQKLPEQDNQTTIIDCRKGMQERNSISPCLRPCLRPKRPSLRRNRPSLTVMFLSSVGAPFLRPGLRFHRAPCAAAVKGSAQPRGATRSRLFVASMASTASTGPGWPLRTAQRLIRLGASELPLPLPTIPTARREAEAGSPLKRLIREASESEIMLNIPDMACSWHPTNRGWSRGMGIRWIVGSPLPDWSVVPSRFCSPAP